VKVNPTARKLRRYFFTGLIVIAPVGVTAVVLVWLFRQIDNILGTPLQNLLSIRIPGLGLVLLVLAVMGVGWAVHRAAGRQILHFWNEALARFPLTGRIYNAMSQIVQTVVGERRSFFRRTVLIPYPTEGIWAVAFVTNEDDPVMVALIGEPCIAVFVPTTPNPTSGFMLIVPKTKIKETGISVDEAMKLVISAGAVSPHDEAPSVRRRGLDLDTLLKDTQA
jgi:uncharacterized membrane protein